MNRSFKYLVCLIIVVGLTGYCAAGYAQQSDIVHLMVSQIEPAASADINTIQAIDVQETGSDVSVVVKFANGLHDADYGVLRTPLGVNIIFKNTIFSSYTKEVSVKSELIESIMCDKREDKNSARVQIKMKKSATYEVARQGNDLVVKYNKSSAALAQQPSLKEETLQEDKQPMFPSSSVNAENSVAGVKVGWVNRVDFEALSGGKAKVIIETSQRVPYKVDRVDAEKKVVLVLENTRVMEYQERPLNAARFKTAVDKVTPLKARDGGNNVLIAVELREMVPYRVEERGNIYTIYFDASKKMSAGSAADMVSEALDTNPMADQDSQASKPEGHGPPVKVFKGQKISLEFQDAEIQNVFRILADVSGQNFVIGDDVKGKITLKLENVPWDQVLDLVLRMNNLGMVLEGNVLRIARMESLQREQDAIAAKEASQQKAEPLYTRYLQVNYAKAGDIQSRINDVKTPRGTCTLDERTNMIIMRDTVEALNAAEAIVKKLDIATKQVLIEARVVEVQVDYKHELGVQWGQSLSHTSQALGSTMSGVLEFQGADASEGWVASLPAGGAFGGLDLSLGRTGGDGNPLLSSGTLRAKLQLMESEGKGKVISNPKVATLDNVEASIEQGSQVPYPKQTQDGVSVAFISASLSLKVTPRVSPDDRIGLLIDISKSEPDWGHVFNGTPAITSKNAKTEVLVKDGETVAIGGIIVENVGLTLVQLPWFSKIPVLGWLFRKQTQSDSTTELLIFITPKIIRETDRIADVR
ncbi:MAG: type IV pilus secretin PilQ [Pseudomonadota bacterium]